MHKSYKPSYFHVRLQDVRRAMAACFSLGILSIGALPAAETPAGAYKIQPGDVLSIGVWKEPDLQSEILVRPDGGFTFPLAGEFDALDLTVAQLQAQLTERIKPYIPDPVVTVLVKQAAGSRIYVVGKVNRPGEFLLSRQMDVMQALSVAGGATIYADVNQIRILRRDGGQQLALAFRYADVERGRKLEQNIVLQSGDTVVVP